LTNLARTIAGAVLRKFEASGYLEVPYRRMRILAPDAPRALLEA
jgi:CRP/FNR family cyclic AMP-dependent transcriptional regulator